MRAHTTAEAAPDLLVLAPLTVEAAAVRAGAPWARVHRTGMGPRRSARSAKLARQAAGSPVMVAGFCGALDPTLEPGDVILPTELRGPTGTTVCDDTTILAGHLQRAGFRVRRGPIASTQRLVFGSRRRALSQSGALAVDMESAWLASAVGGQPLVTLRVVMDTSTHELYRPLRTLTAFLKAYRTLREACGLVQEWAGALSPRELLLASPRASCAGVERAVEIVERVLEEHGAPVYVRKQIVHNSHVVAALEEQGAVFVEELGEVPRGATVIFSAHGVSPAVRREAAERGLDVIDATCPLVAKVHAEARRFAQSGFDIVLVGHEGHEEVDGTFGEAPDRMHVIATPDEIHDLEVRDPDRVAYLTQTTLAVDDTAGVVDKLRERFPNLAGPASSDICYATQNRQDAVRALAAECDIVLVVGSANSSNSRRLVEVSERAGCPALLVEDGGDIPPQRLSNAHTVGLTAGASAPEELVEDVIRAVEGLGSVTVTERTVAREDIHFKLPPQVRPTS